MTVHVTQPFNQKIRITGLRVLTVAMIPLFLFCETKWQGLSAAVLHSAGVFCIITAVLGRFWAIMYIGGHKNRTVMQDGPYSICRHPLYLFSSIGALGFGLMQQSVVVAAIVGGVVFVVLSTTAIREENDLCRMFGADYDQYARRVPRIIPRITGFVTAPKIPVDTGTLARNLRDAVVFVALIPAADVLNWLHALHIVRGITVY